LGLRYAVCKEVGREGEREGQGREDEGIPVDRILIGWSLSIPTQLDIDSKVKKQLGAG